MPVAPELRSFRQVFPKEPVLIEERRQISPHFLGIGKTRKLIDTGRFLVGFYSVGYAIHWFVARRASVEVIATGVLTDMAPAWGGGQFCVDHTDEAVHLAYTSLSRLTVIHRIGRIGDDGIDWEPRARVALNATTPTLAAPWIAIDRAGAVWVSVVGRDNNFLVAHGNSRDGDRIAFRQRQLFEDKPEWHHSCVQVLPFTRRRAIAVGFAGRFPTETVLVSKEIDDELNLGASTVVGPCDVNDQITFHFQALGDPERGRACVTYLGPGGRIDHATWSGVTWSIEEAIVPFATIAPQNTLLSDGEIGVLCADYEGRMFALASTQSGWTKPAPVGRAGLVTISPAFARTGYGTGGIISAARSSDRAIPYLASQVALDPEAPSKLFVGCAGGDEALSFAGAAPIGLAVAPDAITVTLRLAGGSAADVQRDGVAWMIQLQEKTGISRQFWVLGGATPRLLMFESVDGVNAVEGRHITGNVELRASGEGSELIATFAARLERANQGAISAQTLEGVTTSDFGIPIGRMVDLVPYVQEPNSVVTLDPRRLPQLFRRII